MAALFGVAHRVARSFSHVKHEVALHNIVVYSAARSNHLVCWHVL